jgi:VCBS repeat protein/ASPIC/UnbV protein/PPIC-type peptidyl-prolyl cis-trans isomerase-like protein
MPGLRAMLALVAVTLVGAPGSIRQTSPSQSQTPEELTLRIIVVGSADEAQQVVTRLARGESFFAVAAQLSIDPSAGDGGLLGRVAPSSLRPELSAALAGVRVGEITRIVRIPTGFAILKIEPDAPVGTTLPSAPNASLAAAGSVKYALDVSGMGEALVAMNRFPHPPDWDLDPRALCDMRTQSMAGAAASLQQAVSPGAGGDPVQGHYLLGQVYAYYGKMDQSIGEFEAALQTARSIAPSTIPTLEESIGIAYLHGAGFDNDVYRQPGDLCLLSPTGTRAFGNTVKSEKAVEHFLRYLAVKPDDLEVRWLLNLAYMTIGGYPAKVPPEYLIPVTALASAEDVGRFVDVAPRAGLASVASAGGLIVEDFDNDGSFDVVTSSVNSCEGMHVFRRNADGTFFDRAADAGVSDQMSSLNMMQTDYNNDGFADILLLRGGWEFPQRKSLLRNNKNGTFTDVTAASGLAAPATRTQAAAWTDINNDGFLDLFVGTENTPAQLFLNKGDGTFVDIAGAAGVNRQAFTKGVTAGDFDNDGWPDLYVSNIGGPNFLYHNNHDGTFTDLAKPAGVGRASQGFATWFFDYDNDGWLDLFVTSYFTSVDETVRTYLGLPHNAATLKLYRNRGNLTFEDVTRQTGLDKVFMPMGANFGDIDNDGFLDIYLGTGNPSYGSLVPSVLLHNQNGKVFTDVTTSSGTGELHKGHGVAFADLDNDGSDDLVFEVGGATPGDPHAMRLFHNPGHDNDWITLKLVGAKTNRAAIGARIKVTVENAGHGTRAIYRTVGSGGSFGASPLAQHIGLGKAARIDDIQIEWPTTNTRQHFAHADKNRWLEIVEGTPKAVVMDRPHLPLGRPASSLPHAH